MRRPRFRWPNPYRVGVATFCILAWAAIGEAVSVLAGCFHG